MQLREIYMPIEKELASVEQLLKTILGASDHKSVLEISEYLLSSKGKRLRPALVIFSAKASQRHSAVDERSIVHLAAAVELIHMASLIHDDVIDHASIRYHKPTINSRYGQDTSIALGDYLYSVGFDLISSCKNTDIVSCISQATKAMCEGELIQVCERDNLELAKKRYMIIVKNKTASLFAASCQAGAIAADCPRPIESALKEYGLNFGIAFQIIDDCLDLLSEEREIGKDVGRDFSMGELTLPLLNLFSFKTEERDGLMDFFKKHNDAKAFCRIKEKFIHSEAVQKTKGDILIYKERAKTRLCKLECSEFKESLSSLADFAVERLKI